MSSKPWLASLKQTLSQLQPADRLPRVAVIGIGSELNGDDFAGIALARELGRRVDGQSHLLVVDAGPAPENTSGLLRRFGPDLVLLVDAAQMDDPPGSARWLDWQDTAGLSASTHTLPLHLFAGYLTAELGCHVVLIGIQPTHNGVGEALSPAVKQAVQDIALDLSSALIQTPGDPATQI